MEQPTLNDIYLVVGEIKGEVKGINSRLDKVNGRIEKGEERTNKLETFCDTHEGREKGITLIMGIIGAVIGSLISIIGIYLSTR